MQKAQYAKRFCGGGDRIRTDASRFCRPLPYHLGTPPREGSPLRSGIYYHARTDASIEAEYSLLPKRFSAGLGAERR